MGDAPCVVAVQYRHTAVWAVGATAGIAIYGAVTAMILNSCHLSSVLLGIG
jgi:hypothetical protein